MARRSDHTPAQLRALLLQHGHTQMAETGVAKFSGREVAKRAGYTVGTIYNVFGSLDLLLTAINAQTFAEWADYLEAALTEVGGSGGDDRIEALVRAYFRFAEANPKLWAAIYEHHLPEGVEVPGDYLAKRARLTQIVEREVRTALGSTDEDIARLTRSLVATVHGHCSFNLTGTFAMLGEIDPVESALERVRESLAAHQSD